jgi:hypothetical protein
LICQSYSQMFKIFHPLEGAIIHHICVYKHCIYRCKLKAIHTHTCKPHQSTYPGQLICVIMLYITELLVPVPAVSVFYTPDDGRLTFETCRESLQ